LNIDGSGLHSQISSATPLQGEGFAAENLSITLEAQSVVWIIASAKTIGMKRYQSIPDF
jgi:hypothetical protein